MSAPMPKTPPVSSPPRRSSRSPRVRGGPPLPTPRAWTGARSTTTRPSSPAARSLVCEQIVADDDRFLVLARSTVRAARTTDVGTRSSVPFVSLRLHEPTEAGHARPAGGPLAGERRCARPAGSATVRDVGRAVVPGLGSGHAVRRASASDRLRRHGARRGLARAYVDAARDLGYEAITANDHLVFQRPWLDAWSPWPACSTVRVT